jgi:hypothetical protein
MRRSRVIVMTAIALTALSACGSSGGTEKSGGKDGGAQVASLATPEASPSAAAQQKAKTGPPRERLDDTAEEREALMVPFNKCLKKSGFKDKVQGKLTSDRSQSTAEPASKKEENENAAYRACQEQYFPLPAWEKDPANPQARDFARDVVKCLKRKGVKYVEVSDDGISPAFGGDQNDSRSISMGLDLAPECEREVAAAMK